MSDIVYVLITLAFFAAMLGYVTALRGLGARGSSEDRR
jgi:hypothetical protein